MTSQQIAVVVCVVLLLSILTALAILEGRSTRGDDDVDPKWKDDYTGWGG